MSVDSESPVSSDESQVSGDELKADLSTAPRNDPPAVGIGFVGWLRWAWRQLTSMRTALLLLFILALGSIPGSVLPQTPVNPSGVTNYINEHQALGKFFEAIGFFDVFGSPWYGAIYVLLVISLIGCVVPRTRLHWKALRAAPPRAPSRLTRLPESTSWSLTEDAPAPQEILDEVNIALKSRRWRTAESSFDGTTGWVSAEKGYLRETGNLLFHVALLIMLLGVAAGGAFGWKGQALIVEGDSFSDVVTQYDSFSGGRFVNTAALPPFSFTLDKFTATYEPQGGPKSGEPRSFEADVAYRSDPDATPETQTVEVNSPLNIDGAKVFLIGHGYAPVLQVKDSKGKVVFDGPTPFLPTDGNFTSSGVVKMPDTDPQLALRGLFLPTTALDPQAGPHSVYPDTLDPSVFLSAYKGNLGLDNGVPQSVYKLDTSQLTQIGLKALRPGETWTLPDGSGSVTFTGIKQYATFDVASNPGTGIALLAAIMAIAGLMLSLFVPRRRMWVRVNADTVELAGLSRTDEAGLKPTVAEFTDVVRDITKTPADADSAEASDGIVATDSQAAQTDESGSGDAVNVAQSTRSDGVDRAQASSSQTADPDESAESGNASESDKAD